MPRRDGGCRTVGCAAVARGRGAPVESGVGEVIDWHINEGTDEDISGAW